MTPIIEQLRAAGLRPTRQRLLVGGLVLCTGRHVSLNDLAWNEQIVAAQISLATLYNVLNDFERAGLVRRIAVGGKRVFYDANPAEHHHVYDESTGNLIDVDGLELNVLSELPSGYQLRGADVLIRVRASAPAPHG